VYRSISDTLALAEYARVTNPVVQAKGGHVIIRGTPARAPEAGLPLRTSVIEFDSLEKALAAYDDPAYRSAFRLIAGKVDRDFRIIEGRP
jgi:uncharacterized protein (DUF1330 family)